MSSRGEQRRRGTGLSNVSLFGRVAPEVKAKVDRAADAMGISQSRALEEFIRRVDVDEHGRPNGWAGDDQEELPLNRSA
jgi:hypothetical protein